MQKTPSKLSNRILKSDLVPWKNLKFIQQAEFKEIPDDAKARLRTSILENNFIQPLYVWESPCGSLYCLDGKHRIDALHDLESDGNEVPELLPATFINCYDQRDAARLVLVYSSIYAKVTSQGLFDFIKMYDLDYSEMKEQIDLPEFSAPRFEQKFDLHDVHGDTEQYEVEPDPQEAILVKDGDIFQLGDHRVMCGSFQTPATRHALMANQMARIMITDPPYNLPAAVYSKKHGDFAMGAGEMSDEQFVDFLADVMKSGLDYSLPGAIHYIFMDWRHTWHMTEAGRRIYGKAMPKQVCVWVKDQFANGAFYRSQQELCFVFQDGRAKALWNKDLLDEGGFYKEGNELCFVFKKPDGAKHLSHLELVDRTRSNVWKYPAASRAADEERLALKDHPTPKPVAMIADAILDTTNEGDIVLDWFLGTGTAVVACEKTGRICYGTELEPGYTQLTIKRYVNYCRKNGKTPAVKHLNGELTLADFNWDQ